MSPHSQLAKVVRQLQLLMIFGFLQAWHVIPNLDRGISISKQFAICYAHGVALHLINWIHYCSVITGPEGDIISDLPSRFFVQIAQTLIKYKEGTNALMLDLQANCMLDMLMQQINNVVDIDPHISSLWSE